MERRKPLTPDEFLNYVAKLVSPEEMDLWVKVNSIENEKAELFFDFISSFYKLLISTHLGHDTIKTDKDIKGHFDWCWKKNIDNFNTENIEFNVEGEHYDYMWNFFMESFYKESTDFNKVDEYLKKLFKLYIQKTKSELEVFKDLYLVLDKALLIDKSY